MEPIEILKKELTGYKKALRKSIESFDKKEIDFNTHNNHVGNLNRLINKYQEAIIKLKQ